MRRCSKTAPATSSRFPSADRHGPSWASVRPRRSRCIQRMTTSRVISSGTKRRTTSSAWVTWVGSAYVQFGSAVGLWAVGRYVVAPADGVSRTNKYSEVGFDLLRAQILSGVIVQGIKHTVRRDRPSGACCAFPSGHAAAAFAAAAVLERHLGYRLSWPALVGATYVATSRLVDNRHFMSDVIFGAAVGTASGWTVVGTRGRKHPHRAPARASEGGHDDRPDANAGVVARAARAAVSSPWAAGPDARRRPDRVAR